MKKLEDWQVKDLLTETSIEKKWTSDGKDTNIEVEVVKWPCRAIRWAWYSIPKTVFVQDEEGGFYKRITSTDSTFFKWLKDHRDDYYAFLKENLLEKSVYDKFIGKYEAEERTTW